MIDKALVEKAADMMCLGYTDEQIVRMLRVPIRYGEELISMAEEWNYHEDMAKMEYSYTEISEEDILWLRQSCLGVDWLTSISPIGLAPERRPNGMASCRALNTV